MSTSGNENFGQGPQQHRLGEHWGVDNPIPTIQDFVTGMNKSHQDQPSKPDDQADVQHKQQRADAIKHGDVLEHEPRKVDEGKVRTVTDPTTGKEIEVEDQGKHSLDAVKNPTLNVPNANLGKPTTVRSEADQPLPEYKEKQDVTAPPDPVADGTTSDVPIRGEKTNILFHPTPTVTYKPMFEQLERTAAGLCIAIMVAIIFLGRFFGGSLIGLVPLATFISSIVWLWMKEVVRSGTNMEWRSEQLRGETATANLLPESVEWMNTFLGVMWGLINPDMLTPIADTIEDVMQASVPGVIENVRIAEIDQGNNPLRILSMRALPDAHVQNLKDNAAEENKKSKDPQEAAAIEEGGSYYNLELSFAYHAKPSGQSASSKAQNMHMNLVFYLGVKGLFGVPFPVFVELSELVGTVRLRLQMSPEPPFMKEVTFSLVGIPYVKAGCMPMVKRGVNILNLPLISNFVNYAISTACSLVAAPKSMTIDLSMMLKGDDIDKDTQALGIMWVRIHRAIGLSKQDRRGSKGGGSDPYINLSFSKYGKPMYCTRVITDDLNPIWEETAALLVTPELIKADEKLSVELWDSDRNSADDIVGKVELSIREMLQHPGKMYPQVSHLRGLDDGSEMPGELHWEVGFFGKPKLRPELRSDGKDRNLPETVQGNPQFEDPKGVITNEEEDAVVNTPPDPLWPSAILHIVVHQIVNLELVNIKGSEGNRRGREYEPAKPYGETSDERGEHLPTSYVQVILNDELVYRTRAKAVSSKPIFNASTEQFIRDWRSGIVTVVVRDQRYREHDPILGVVPIKLSELFQTSSQVTRWYPLDGGIGFGRVRLSLLVRHVETKLPPQMLGWDVGTFEFVSDRITLQNYSHTTKIKLRTGGSTGKISSRLCRSEQNDTILDLSDEQFRKSIRLPVRHRYRSPVVFELHTVGKRGAAAYAVLWLQRLVDNEETDIDLPIWTTKAGARLTQNYITEENWRAKEVPGLEDLTEVGRLQLRGRFSPGMDDSHRQFVTDNNSRETFEAWEACVDQGVRHHSVEADIPDEVQERHEQSLVQGRDVLKQADPRERKRWIDKQGQDWSGAFGEDPRAYVDSRGKKIAEPGCDRPPHDPHVPPPMEEQPRKVDGERKDDTSDSESDYDDDEGDGGDSDSSVSDDNDEHEQRTISTRPSGTSDAVTAEATNSSSSAAVNKGNKRSERRQHRGLMQWKPARNVVFAKDEAKFGLSKLKKKMGMGGLSGREPDIETETGR